MRKEIGVLALFSVAACGDSGRTPWPDYEVKATVQPAIARVGEKVDVTVSVQNISAQTKEFNTNACFTAFEVHDASGAHVAPRSEQNCFAYATRIVLGPGETYSITQQWSGDALRSVATGNVQPGEYSVTGNLIDGDRVTHVPAQIRLTP